jgi:hypothetical protein
MTHPQQIPQTVSAESHTPPVSGTISRRVNCVAAFDTIKPDESNSGGRKFARYLPIWA